MFRVGDRIRAKDYPDLRGDVVKVIDDNYIQVQLDWEKRCGVEPCGEIQSRLFELIGRGGK